MRQMSIPESGRGIDALTVAPAFAAAAGTRSGAMQGSPTAEVVVQKFGGSSVADPERLGRVADRVAATVRSGRRVVVVVSAMGKTTDQLIALAQSVSESPPRRELDMLLSTGERISMALLAMALETRGLDAISFTGSQSGILTNDRHSGARIIEVRPIRIEDELARGRVVIVAGFQGMSYRREITTLGRGGSDTTAVALAAALGADCEIYSDVDGVYSADPRVVPEARRFEEISYEEMLELAEHGAKVLNAQAVAWAARAGVVIHARATRDPADQGRETRIGPVAPRADRIAVTGSSRVVRVDASGRALELLDEAEVPLRSVDGGAIRLVRDDVPDWPRIAALLAESGAQVREEGEVTIVGGGLGSSPARLRAALACAVEVTGLPLSTAERPSMLDYVAAPLRLTVRCPPASVDALTRALHELVSGSSTGASAPSKIEG
jgi:aspartate kinase